MARHRHVIRRIRKHHLRLVIAHQRLPGGALQRVAHIETMRADQPEIAVAADRCSGLVGLGRRDGQHAQAGCAAVRSEAAIPQCSLP